MEPQTKERLTLAAAGAALALVLAAGSWVGTFRPWATEGPEASRSAPGIRATGVDMPFEVELGELRRMACGLVNATDRTLEIASISTGCACRTASFRPSTLEPGEKADVEIVYDSSHGTARDLKFPIVVTCADGETIKADKEISIHHEQSIKLMGAPLDLGGGARFIHRFRRVCHRDPGGRSDQGSECLQWHRRARSTRGGGSGLARLAHHSLLPGSAGGGWRNPGDRAR
jgi:hypothetical protein